MSQKLILIKQIPLFYQFSRIKIVIEFVVKNRGSRTFRHLGRIQTVNFFR